MSVKAEQAASLVLREHLVQAVSAASLAKVATQDRARSVVRVEPVVRVGRAGRQASVVYQVRALSADKAVLVDTVEIAVHQGRVELAVSQVRSGRQARVEPLEPLASQD